MYICNSLFADFYLSWYKTFQTSYSDLKKILTYLLIGKVLFYYVCCCHFCSNVSDFSSGRKYIWCFIPIIIIFFLLFFIIISFCIAFLENLPVFPIVSLILLFQIVNSDFYWWDFNPVTVFYLSWNNFLFHIISSLL